MPCQRHSTPSAEPRAWVGTTKRATAKAATRSGVPPSLAEGIDQSAGSFTSRHGWGSQYLCRTFRGHAEPLWANQVGLTGSFSGVPPGGGMHQCSAAPHQIRAITHTGSELQGLESPGFGKGLGGGHLGLFRFTQASAVPPLQPTLPCGHLFISKQSELRQTRTTGRRRLATTEHHIHEAPTGPAPINTHGPYQHEHQYEHRPESQHRQTQRAGPPTNRKRPSQQLRTQACRGGTATGIDGAASGRRRTQSAGIYKNHIHATKPDLMSAVPHKRLKPVAQTHRDTPLPRFGSATQQRPFSISVERKQSVRHHVQCRPGVALLVRPDSRCDAARKRE